MKITDPQTKKTYTLDAEEQDILAAFESGAYTRSKNFKATKKRLEQSARDTLRKKKSITIRINEHDLSRLKSKAAEEGMPYQTLISSILHKSVS